MPSDLVPRVGVLVQKSGETEPVFEDITEFVTAFSFEDNAKLVDKATISLDNHKLQWLDHPSFQHNNIVDVQWGYVGRMTPRRRCVIAALKGGFPVLTVEALGHAIKMDGVTKTRTFQNMTRSAVVQKIAEEHRFATDAQIEDTKVVYPTITQAGITDAAFVQALAKKEGFHFFVGLSGLHWHRRDLQQQPIKELCWFSSRGNGDLLSLDYEEDHKTKKGKKTGVARDPITKKPIKATASNTDTPRTTLGTVVSGPSKTEVGPLTTNVGGTTGTLTPDIIVVKEETKPTSEASAQGAKRAVDGSYQAEHHKAIKLRGTMVGDPDVIARRIVIFSGIGHRLHGPWYVTKAVHKIDQGGYITEFECERDTHNGYKDSKRDVKAKGTPNTKPVKGPEVLIPKSTVIGPTGETEQNGWTPFNAP